MAENIQTTPNTPALDGDDKKLPERIADAAKALPGEVAGIAKEVPARVAEAGHALQDALDEQIRLRPIVVGGIAIGVGAVLGGLFARTRFAKLVTFAGLATGIYFVAKRGGDLPALVDQAKEKLEGAKDALEKKMDHAK